MEKKFVRVKDSYNGMVMYILGDWDIEVSVEYGKVWHRVKDIEGIYIYQDKSSTVIYKGKAFSPWNVCDSNRRTEDGFVWSVGYAATLNEAKVLGLSYVNNMEVI